MAETPDGPEPIELPKARTVEKRRGGVPLVWIVPLIALLIGAWLAWRSISETGPAFVITFKTAEGIEAGKTKIKYKSVDVGIVESIELSRDRSKVLIHARMEKYAAGYLVEDSRFWVVRPRIVGANVQGLDTLLSGSFIGMEVGTSPTERREFTGLAEQPVVTADDPGRHFILKSDTLGSISLGSPVYFRRFPVGEVESYQLDKDGKGVVTRVFIKAPYDQYVNAETRFWEASGIDLKLDASGVSLDTESLASILVGGIAFQTRGDAKLANPAAENAEFRLFKNRGMALSFEDVQAMQFAFSFRESLRGLSIGAPVDFRGIVVGEVTDIRPQITDDAIYMVAFANIYPDRTATRQAGESVRLKRGWTHQQAFDELVRVGMRGQVRTGNLLTGQLYIALDVFKGAKPAKIAWDDKPPQFPTIQGSLTGVEENIATITKKLAAVPFEEIGRDLKRSLIELERTLQSVDRLAKNLDQETRPEISEALADLRKSLDTVDRTLAQDAPLQQDLREALREISRAAASMRMLTDYLEQHPESLIRGKSEEKP